MKQIILIILVISSQFCSAMQEHNLPLAPLHNPTSGLFQNNNSNSSSHNENEQKNDNNAGHVDKKQKREYPCTNPNCDRTFASASGMKEHAKTHKDTLEEQKPYICGINGCNERFSQKAHRHSHQLSLKHSDRKQYPCTESGCDANFTRQGDLINHINIKHLHIAPKFTCAICNQAFSRASNLETHRRTHTGEKPYACLCGKAFPRSDALKKHRETCDKPAAAILLNLGNSNSNNNNGISNLIAPGPQDFPRGPRTSLNNEHQITNNNNLDNDSDDE